MPSAYLSALSEVSPQLLFQELCRLHNEIQNFRYCLKPLQEIGTRMEGQDNQCTAHPIFVVQQRRRFYGLDQQYTDSEIVWLYNGDEVDTNDEDLARAKEHYEKHLEELEGWARTSYIDIYEFVQPFFSRVAADEYIKANRHRLNDPRVYVDSAYRNPEWQAVRDVLVREEGSETHINQKGKR
ncbi:MAG: hypothetical protein GY854_21725 [Deltaproteobacteria bacterium]|nr:hypothetical protein [Deltaproteobacteria bacterium]